jgi:threonine 3-dehydrogenase
MRAIVKTREGTGVELLNLADPEPGPDDVVIRVSAVGICGGDIGIYDSNSSGASGGVGYPFIPGHEASGEVVRKGDRVEGFEVGDRIAVETHIPCRRCYSCQQGYLNLCDKLRIFGVTRGTNGAFAEYAVVPSVVAYKLPAEITDEQGALLEPFGVGVHSISESGLRVGDTATVTGCGPIGLFIIALLRLGGATEIIASDVSPYRLQLARTMGATTIVNPKTEDLQSMVDRVTRKRGSEIVFEASGNPQALVQAFEIVAKRGRLIVVAGHPNTPPLNLTKNLHLKETTVKGIYGREIWGTWNRAASLLSSGKLELGPIVTHHFPLDRMDDAIATAKRAEAGKIIVTPR